MNLQFTYTNWHGRKHTYLVRPERINASCGPGNAEYAKRIVLHGLMLEKDGAHFPFPPRRTFKLVDMRDMKEVPAP